jgi:EpsD family peptidyl-prolyl cis-trans isomerase
MDINTKQLQGCMGWQPMVMRSAAALAVAVALAACGGGNKADKPASQTAAKVNKEEITVHQINAVLSQQRNLRPDQTEAASFQVLQRLVDQELAVQKAAELKLDRDPQVMQRIEAARREIIARAYADKISEGATKPTPEEINKYYDDNPALFKERRVYQLQEIAIEASPEQQADVRAKIAASKNAADLVEKLKAANMKYAGNQASRSAEQLPMAAVAELAKLKEGESVVRTGTKGLTVVYVVAAAAQPVTLERASKAIEQFLLNERKRKLLKDDVKSLRDSASIVYVGKFADAASAAPKGAAAASDDAASAVLQASPAMMPAITVSNAGAAAASAAEAADAAVKAASDVDAQSITKGLGLK